MSGELHEYMKDQRLRSEERLHKRWEFLRVQRGGGPWTRLGVTVSRKVGNAVIRNKVKRRLRESFRQQKARLPAGFDLVLIARSGAHLLPQQALAQEVMEAADRAARKARRQRQPPGAAQPP